MHIRKSKKLARVETKLELNLSVTQETEIQHKCKQFWQSLGNNCT